MNYRTIFISILLALMPILSNAQQYRTVSADEAPFEMAPLKMHIFPDKDFVITKYGAKAGDVKANTQAFKKAIEACNKAGGGRVVVPSGVWITGPIHLKSNVNLYLSEEAEVLFPDDPQLYLPAVKTSWEGFECYNYSPLVYAYECENIAITGPGMLRARMDKWKEWFVQTDTYREALKRLYSMASSGVPVEYRQMATGGERLRPHLIHLNRCTNVSLEGFKIRESPFWTVHVYMCKEVHVNGLDVYAHGSNNDGIDIEMSQRMIVENCTFDQGDDAVIIKAGRNQDAWRLNTPTQDIVIRNCNVVNAHCLLGLGSEISGGVRRVYMHDCSSSNEVYRLFYIKTNHRRGGFIEDITVENVHATKMLRVFEIDTDVLYQWRDIVPTYETRITEIKNITIKNATAQQADAIYELRGDSRKPIENVLLENIHVKRVNKFINNTEHVRDLIIKNVNYDVFEPQEMKMSISGEAVGR